MAQIMKYHGHPKRGVGQSVAYTASNSGLRIASQSFTVDYDWNNRIE